MKHGGEDSASGFYRYIMTTDAYIMSAIFPSLTNY